ncbi:porin [Paraburkholderia caballeronis]|uniref:Outer membrane protein (Porin) n=1 Tax=Paraburkholderia caballeronis TaxID=416943 RepID=A0A1H7M163_9BURK|nr:porin [Paraburkholderia caballeronis]PXW28681.1 putative porin [Paraburkholderia caballeronis]PXX04047.1 putative porin [Paraburkholderia caballeronis]RAK04791.1 putative porin [Paraburkholderia caballeronis]TDV39166.1 putative porin [Paraburkholderia caballeronis]SED64824.1 Outer membrane protein (porin) [Paraburkholderia caballeronis]
MKKPLLAGAAMAGMMTTPVFAQSSVTLYGLIDQGVNYVSNVQTGRSGAGALQGQHQIALSDGATGIGGSRWGLKGSEDLGGGLRAIFTLENGFNINTGGLAQGGLLFGRQAFVGLANPYGQLTFGRQYSIVSDMLAPLSQAGEIPGHMGANPDDLDDLGHSIRINNSIKFRSTSYGGFVFGAMYSLGGVAGATGRNQLWALSGTYANGPLSAGVGYLNARNPNLSYFGTNGNSGGDTVNNMGSAGSATAGQTNTLYAGFASARSMQLAVAGAKYKFGAATIGATVSHLSFDDLGDATSGPNPLHYSGTAVFNNGEVNATWAFTSAFSVNAAYSYTRKASVGQYGSATYHQGELSAAYFLSKRTELYALAIYQQASGTDSLGQSAVASITQLTASSTNKQALVRLGILHLF